MVPARGKLRVPAFQCILSIIQYNAALILLRGTECGRLKPNIKAALIKFEEVQKQGDIDATDIISKLVVIL